MNAIHEKRVFHEIKLVVYEQIAAYDL